MNRIIKFIIPCILLFSCQKERSKIKSQQGGIDIITNIYFNASQGLDSIQSYHVSKLNYKGDLDMGTLEQAKKVIISDSKNKWFSISKKPKGIVFFNKEVPKYAERKDINDTILFDKQYKRFEINSENSFSRYYIYKTDTILPYSLNNQIDKDYNGRLERIDTYLKNKDMFITFQLLPHHKIDDEAQDIFDFQEFVKNR